MKGHEYFLRSTNSDFERALSLYEEAARLDPNFAQAHAQIANISQEFYRAYGPNAGLLERAEQAAGRVRELEGESAQYFSIMSLLSLRRGEAEGALRYALRAVEIDPAYSLGYNALGFAYRALGRNQETAKAWMGLVRLLENDRNAHFNLLIALHELGSESELHEAAARALPIYERYVRLTPDDYNARVQLATILGYCGRSADSVAEADRFSAIESLDGVTCYNLACLYLNANMPDRGMSLLRRAVRNGFHNIESIRRDPDLAPLRGTPEFEELMKELEAGNV